MQSFPDSENLLRFEGVVKHFKTTLFGKSVRALDGLDLEVRAGQVVGLVGPNGAGKTTAFRIAAGLLKPGSGTVTVFRGAPGSPVARALAGYMPEQPGLPGTLTPNELLHFIGRLHGKTAAERADRIAALERLLDLSGYMNRRIARFSKGMVKRTGLAAALFNRPRLLLLDEPVEGLAPIGSAALEAHILPLSREGAGVLVSSHILSDIQAICGRIIIIHNGKVVLHGDRDTILVVRDRMVVRFRAPEGEPLLQSVRRLIESRGGNVDFAGHPQEELESLFRKIMERQGASSGGAGS